MTPAEHALCRKLEQKNNEIEDLRNALRGIVKFLRAGDDDGSFDDSLAVMASTDEAVSRPFPRHKPWHLVLIEEIDELLDPSVQYAPFDPDPVPAKTPPKKSKPRRKK